MKLADSILEELWFAEDDTALADDKASKSFAAKLAEIQGLKPFPVVAQKIIALLANPDFKAGAVASAIEEDPSLAAGVLRTANSALFSGSANCDSVHQAFMRLGANVVRDVVISVATMALFPDKTGMGKVFRDHCAATAAITQTLARDFTPRHTKGIFLSGLMHDVGKLLLMDTGEVDYQAPEFSSQSRPDSVHLAEREVLGYDHAVLGAHVLRSWKLPDPIPQVVAWHHQPTRAYQDPELGPMVAMLRIAGEIDAHLATDPGEYEEFARKLASGTDCEFARVSADMIIDRWPTLYDTRADAFSLFS